MIENFGETYVERARRLREQLANLQPIPQYEESIADHSIAVDVVLPSSEGFMQTNTLSEPSEVNEAR